MKRFFIAFAQSGLAALGPSRICSRKASNLVEKTSNFGDYLKLKLPNGPGEPSTPGLSPLIKAFLSHPEGPQGTRPLYDVKSVPPEKMGTFLARWFTFKPTSAKQK